jgi:hypothetical protein
MEQSEASASSPNWWARGESREGNGGGGSVLHRGKNGGREREGEGGSHDGWQCWVKVVASNGPLPSGAGGGAVVWTGGAGRQQGLMVSGGVQEGEG